MSLLHRDTARSGVPHPTPSILTALAPIMVIVLSVFLIIGLALPVLPLHVRQGFGFGPFMVGLVTGSQFGASLLSRFRAGRTCDESGPKRAVLIGLFGASVAGACYLASIPFAARPGLSVSILLIGRGILGAAEGFIMTGCTVWGLARLGPANAGRAIAWIGTAMFLAFAISAPLGLELYRRAGFAGVAAITASASPQPSHTGSRNES